MITKSKIQNTSKISGPFPGFDFIDLQSPSKDRSGSPILIMSPHPDDDVIGMGGTMAALAAGGSRVVCVYVTTGSAPGAKNLADIRRAEALAALKVVRAAGAFFLNHDSSGLKRKRRALGTQLRSIIAALRPAAMYLPSPFERHPTHRLVAQAALAAADALNPSVPLWGYSVWGGVYGLRGMQAVDITDYLGMKKRAIRRHASQLAVKPYDRGVLGRNAYEGIYLETHDRKHVAAAEVFLDLRLLKAASRRAGARIKAPGISSPPGAAAEFSPAPFFCTPGTDRGKNRPPVVIETGREDRTCPSN